MSEYHASGRTEEPAGSEPVLAEADRRPRILLLIDRIPGLDSGYGMRVGNVINGLREAGRLHVCLIDGSVWGEQAPSGEGYTCSRIRAREVPRVIKALRSVGALPVHLRYRDQRTLRRELAALMADDWDLLWCSRLRAHVASRGLAPTPRIVDFDDLGDRLMLSEIRDRTARRGWWASAPRNLHGWLDAVRWRRLQRRTARSAAWVVVCSADDARYLGEPNTAIVPNGYPPPEPGSPMGIPLEHRSTPSLLFVGALTYEPNLLAVEWMVWEVLPLIRRTRPDVKLVVVGAIGGAARLADEPGLILTGHVPDVAPYYGQASVAITPLHSGGGTRLKVIEALARSVPLVSTSFACEGLGLTAQEHVYLAERPAEFARACLTLLDDPERAAELARAGLARYWATLTAERSCRAAAELATATLDQHGRVLRR